MPACRPPAILLWVRLASALIWWQHLEISLHLCKDSAFMYVFWGLILNMFVAVHSTIVFLFEAAAKLYMKTC